MTHSLAISARSAAILEAARAVLDSALPEGKTAAAARAGALADAAERDLDDGAEAGPPWGLDGPEPPLRPARPTRPPLAPPGAMPRRRLSSQTGRIALLHAVAHIEFNAIDLAFDMALRFASDISLAGLDPAAFVTDWARIGAEEARHFQLVETRLSDLGASYGDLPAHDGLWASAEATADDVLARLAIAPLVLEARGLDVTPGMIDKLSAAGDKASAAVLSRIYADEIGHVAVGRRWFEAVCERRGLAPASTFRALVATRFKGDLKPPFNVEGRAAAGMTPAFYLADAG